LNGISMQAASGPIDPSLKALVCLESGRPLLD